MSNGLRKLLRKTREFLRGRKEREPLPGRTFVRSQGCWNCAHFDQGPLFEQHKITTGMRDVRVLVEEKGNTPEQAARYAGLRERQFQERGAGLCLGGGSKADFVSAKYLCSKWSAKKGAAPIDRYGGGADLLPEELKEVLGDPKPGAS